MRSENAVTLHTSDAADMARPLKSTMRLRPGRIIVGEPSVSLVRSRIHRALSRPAT